MTQQHTITEALETLLREAQAVADDHHRPRYIRLDNAISSARAALASQGAAPASASCAIRYIGGMHSTWKCDACGYTDMHDSHPGCRRAAPTGAGDAELTQCPKCKAPCTTTIAMRGGEHGWGTSDLERTRYHYAAPQQPAEAAPVAIPAEVHTALRHAGLVLVRTVHGMEVVPMIQGVAADAALANNKKGGEHAD